MDPLFEVHQLNEGGLQKARKIATEFDDLLTNIRDDIGTGREASIVKTKLEEACFYAKKALALQPHNQLRQQASA